ncbi:MAG: substrate-binding domain-containing protein, partial [Thiotrichaceae bacterium]|nr:substrate-binding domain-containing protein [Thiotrichaceae bacterium]
MKRIIIPVLISMFFCSSMMAADLKLIRLATTTSTENSGLLNYLLPAFTKESGYKVHVIAVGTGKALRLGKDGDVDVVLVHALQAEKDFVDSGYGVKRYPVMYNDFVVIGPEDDPAKVNNAKSVKQAFQLINDSKSLFISRGDNSGTHKKELNIWKQSGIHPAGSWYREVGQGMGKVLQMANELDAYTLTDRGTWLSYKDKVKLEILYQNDAKLHNPYGIIAVTNVHYPNINIIGANTLIKWLTSKRGQQLIGQYKKYKQ